MLPPTNEDYIQVINQLVEQFEQQHTRPQTRGRLLTYSQRVLLGFFILMQFRTIVGFKAQRRWLETHPEEARRLGFPRLPHRTTLSRRYKQLAPYLQELMAYVGQWAEGLGEEFSSHHVDEDKSLFKARGPVWHQTDREAGVIPEGLRNLDTDASWSKSAYHGWVYGYGVHLTANQESFPKLAQVETASVSESTVLDDKESALIALAPFDITGDDGYTNLIRTARLAKAGLALITPGWRLGDGPRATAYKQFIREPDNQALLRSRKRVIEAPFDLISKLAGTTDNHKQLPVKGLRNVGPFLLLAVFLLQVTMIVNSIWQLPLRNISHMMAVFT
jgi:hypothetical protein